MAKTAIAVLSDPHAGSDEALGRLFNAMLMAYELKQKNQDVAIVFQGAGTRWASEIVKPDHPAHALYQAVADKIVGVCGGCADVFGAAEGARGSGMPIVRELAVPGTSGVTDLSKYLDDGYRLLTF